MPNHGHKMHLTLLLGRIVLPWKCWMWTRFSGDQQASILLYENCVCPPKKVTDGHTRTTSALGQRPHDQTTDREFSHRAARRHMGYKNNFGQLTCAIPQPFRRIPTDCLFNRVTVVHQLTIKSIGHTSEWPEKLARAILSAYESLHSHRKQFQKYIALLLTVRLTIRLTKSV